MWFVINSINLEVGDVLPEVELWPVHLRPAVNVQTPTRLIEVGINIGISRLKIEGVYCLEQV